MSATYSIRRNMPKRKRRSSENIDPAHPSRIEQRLFHGGKLLHRALKTAKTFERQKLIRRARSADHTKSQAEIQRIGAETESLKTLNLLNAAQTHLQKCVLKDRQLRTFEILQRLCHSKTPQPKDTAANNALARLFNSKVAKETVKAFLSGLRFSLGLETWSSKNLENRSEELRQRALFNSPNSNEENFQQHLGREERRSRNSLGAKRNDLGDFGGQPATSSESPAQQVETRPNRLQNRYSRPLRRSPSPSTYSRPESQVATQENFQTQVDERSGSSAFIPALTVGGYWSGSESGLEEEDPIDANIGLRRNRRGQRARQRIWEKKFGRKARHLQHQGGQAGGTTNRKLGEIERDYRDIGWNVQKGAQQEISKNPKYKPGWERTSGGDIEDSTSIKHARQMEKNKSRHDSSKDHGCLHPSWAAARQAKEQKNLGIESYAGNKVVFD